LIDRRERLIARARQGFRVAFGTRPSRFFRAPGRINLIGEHVDYNQGFVLPCAIDRDTIVALGPPDPAAKGRFLDAVAIDMGSARDRFSLDEPIVRSENNWQNHVRGVVHAIRSRGHQIKPARIAIVGDVPIGAGLSSSASLGVAVALAISDYSGLSLSPVTLAKIAQEAENDFVGCACGIMDQMVSACATDGSAFLLDCQSLQNVPVPVSPALAIAAIDTGFRRQLTESGFNKRREECALAAKHYGVTSLRDLTAERLEADRGSLDEVLFRRARHVVQEMALVEPTAMAMAKGKAKILAEVMAISHQSLSEDFEVSLPAIDRLVQLISATFGDAGGVRLTGAGFGGSLVAIARREAMAGLQEAIDRHYNPAAQMPARVEIFSPAAGASVVPVN
jgi:galactokinase